MNHLDFPGFQMNKWFAFIGFLVISTLSLAAPLPADQVFQIHVRPVDANAFSLEWDIKPGYFIYKDRIRIALPRESNFSLASLSFPQSETKTDKRGKSYAIYREKLQLTVPVLGESPGESLAEVHYQGCSDEGFCYPPEVRQIRLGINQELALTGADLETITTAQAKTESRQDNIALALNNHHWTVSLLLFFGFGLLLSFTPCVLPMVPVLSGIILGQGKDLGRQKSFMLSLSYVLSMSVTYALVGAGVALMGQNLQIAMQSPWAISLFSLSFIALSLSMFGLFELQLPQAWQAKLAGITRSQNGGHYLGAAIMGSLSTLILSPCVTAPLIAVLGYIANSGNVIFGIFTLFFLGLGMGTPLLLIGSQAGRWLPSAGSWMLMIKHFFGLLLLVIAISLMSRILPPFWVMLAWAALFIFAGIYCSRLENMASLKARLARIFGVLLILYGSLVLIGAILGQTSPLQILNGSFGKAKADNPHVLVHSLPELQEAIRQARGKPVFVDFYADWCTACTLMEATTFQNPAIQQALQSFVWLKADITANRKAEKILLKKYGIIAPPTFLFFDKEGQPMPAATLVGEVSGGVFLEHLKSLQLK